MRSTTDQVGSFHVCVLKLSIGDLTKSNQSDTLIDTGASHHCVPNKEFFIQWDTNFNRTNSSIEFATGETKKNLIMGRGTCQIPLTDVRGKLCYFTLHNCLYVPTFTKNIVSLANAVESGARFDFNIPGKEFMTSSDGNTFRITTINKLYTLNTFVANTAVSRSVDEWHSIFGHTNFDYIKKLPSCIDKMSISRSKPKDVCSPCIKAKMQRSINHKLDTRAHKPFEHIYCDLSVLSEPINDTYNFIFGAIDDHSGYLAIYLLKSKSDTPQAFKMFLADHVHFGPVKIVQSDQESVFTSDAFQEI